MEWLQQQVVKRRTKRDYKPSYPGPVQYSMVQPSSIYFNDAKWTSMWYIVSIINEHAVHCSCELLTLKNTDHCRGFHHFLLYCRKYGALLNCSTLPSLTKILQWMNHQARLILKGKKFHHQNGFTFSSSKNLLMLEKAHGYGEIILFNLFVKHFLCLTNPTVISEKVISARKKL